MNKLIRVVIITQGISRIIRPLVENSKVNIVGICESSLRKEDTIFKKKLKNILNHNDLKKYCKEEKLDYYYLRKNNYDCFDSWIDEKNPDLIIVYSMSQLLKKTTLEIPRLGVVNIHPSYLPYYKGANPWFWQYYDMLEEFGVTLHYIDEGMDTGDIIYQEKYPVPLGMKSPEMHDHAIGDIAVRMLYRLIEKISLGHELQRTKQPITKLKIARNIKPEEHSQIVSWYEWEITRVWHLLRGTESWLNSIPQPRWLYSGQRWEILDYHKCDTSDYKVGKIYKKNSKYFLVCKDGIINLKVSLKMKNTLIYILIKLGIWN